MKLDKMKSLLSKSSGMARQNLFFVELPRIDGTNLEDLNLLCRTASLPGKQILTHERRIGMTFEKVAYGYAVDDVTLSFMLVNDYSARNYFDAWRESILNEDGGTVKYKIEYQKPVKIHQLKAVTDPPPGINNDLVNLLPTFVGMFGNRKLSGITSQILNFLPEADTFYQAAYSVELIDAFPTTITNIDFNNEEAQVMEMSVQLSYTNWRKIASSQQFYRG